MAEVFEFYDLDSDILLRGEIGIHRIDLNGNINGHLVLVIFGLTWMKKRKLK